MDLSGRSAATGSCCEWHDRPSVYIHVPFCRHRCGYCNFSLVAGRDYLIPRFLEAMRRDVAQAKPTDSIPTLYLGGGTPSHLSFAQLSELMEIVRERFRLSAEAEVTVEANPEDVSREWARFVCDLGVTRVSLGVQSLRSAKLRLLERRHTPGEAQRAVALCRDYFGSISVDLMFAAPGETLEEWREELGWVQALPIDHVSTYELTIEKGTRFWNRALHGELISADEDRRADLYEAAIAWARTRGWNHYEISSFAASGHDCRHNIRYWTGGDYLGFGPGAASFWKGRRSTNHPSVVAYLRALESGRSPRQHTERLAPPAAARERLVIGLRMLAGWEAHEFRRKTGFPWEEVVGSAIGELTTMGLIHCSAHRIRLTPQGVMLYDSVASRLLASAELAAN